MLLFGCVPAEEEERGTLEKSLEIICFPFVATGMGGVQVLSHDGIDYNYYVYIPSNYSSCEEYPVVLNFHGGAQNATIFKNKAFMTELQAKADDEDVILVWVDSAVPIGMWNNNLLRSLFVTHDHVGMVSELVDTLESDFSVDSSKVHLLGFSEGAIFVQYLSLQLPNTFASVVAISGITGEFFATDLLGSPTRSPYFPGNWNSALVAGPYQTYSIWPDHQFPTSSNTPILFIRGGLDGFFDINGSFRTPGSGGSLTFPIINLTKPAFSDYRAWQSSLGCSVTPTVVVAPGLSRKECVGGSADMFVDVFGTMTHEMPSTVAVGYDGAGHVMDFIVAH